MEKELLYRFFEGSASEQEERRVLDWLDSDPTHRKELLAERRLFDMMLLASQKEKQSQGRRFVLPRWTRQTLKYAAVALIALGVGDLFILKQYGERFDGENTISVPAGQHVNVKLPDGTRVCMNALSELNYPTFFVGNERKVQLKGEAFFEVAHDTERPFVVETYACNVEVLGTKFNVRARAEEQEFVTSLIEGRVHVTDRDNAGNSIALKPREQVEKIDGRLVLGKLPDYEEFLWREGMIAFRNASFREMLDEFEHYYGVKIRLERNDLTKNLFTGKIRISEGIEHALWILKQSADFSYARDACKNEIYIY